MEDGTKGRVDRKTIGLSNRMGQSDIFNVKRADLKAVLQRYFMKRHFALNPALTQLVAQQMRGKGGGVDGRGKARPEPAHRANMILMRVGENNSEDIVLIGF